MPFCDGGGLLGADGRRAEQDESQQVRCRSSSCGRNVRRRLRTRAGNPSTPAKHIHCSESESHAPASPRNGRLSSFANGPRAEIGCAAMPATDSNHTTDTTFGSDSTATIKRNLNECFALVLQRLPKLYSEDAGSTLGTRANFEFQCLQPLIDQRGPLRFPSHVRVRPGPITNGRVKKRRPRRPPGLQQVSLGG